MCIPHGRWMTSRSLSLLLILASLATTAACRRESGGERDARAPGNAVTATPSPAPDTARTAANTVPASVEAIGHHAENIYDMAKLGDWARARAATDSLRAAIDALPAPATADAGREAVSTTFGELDRAVARKDRTAALRASNRLTELGAHLSAAYQPQVPSEVTLLDYYGRELEIWAAAGDRAKLRETASAMRRTWDALRPRLDARGGSAEAAHFEALVAQVEAAATPRDYARLATPVLDAVDSLEQVFKR